MGIVIGSFMSNSTVPTLGFSDKWIHFVFYFILAFLLFLARKSDTKRKVSFVSRISFVVVIAMMLGVVIELVQHFCIAGRQGDFYDILANMLGIILAVVIGEALKIKGVL